MNVNKNIQALLVRTIKYSKAIRNVKTRGLQKQEIEKD